MSVTYGPFYNRNAASTGKGSDQASVWDQPSRAANVNGAVATFLLIAINDTTAELDSDLSWGITTDGLGSHPEDVIPLSVVIESITIEVLAKSDQAGDQITELQFNDNNFGPVAFATAPINLTTSLAWHAFTDSATPAGATWQQINDGLDSSTLTMMFIATAVNLGPTISVDAMRFSVTVASPAGGTVGGSAGSLGLLGVGG